MRHIARTVRQQFIGIVALAGLIGAAASAATGGPLLLGKSNITDKPTGVQNTGTGAVLDLKAKAGQPPLKTNSPVKVKNLNADQLDGRDVSALALASAVYTKAQADLRFALAGAAYTKSQADAAFLSPAEAYTKGQADARFGGVLYRKSFSGTTPNGGVFGQVLDSFDVQIPGPGMVLVMLEEHAGSDGVQVVFYVGEPSAYLFGVLPSGGTADADFRLVSPATGETHFELRLTDPSLGLRPYSGEALIVFYPDS